MEGSSVNNQKTKAVLKAILFCIAFTLLFIALSFLKYLLPPNFERLAHGVAGTLAAFLTTAFFLKLDRKRFSDIGLVPRRGTVSKFIVGVLAGVLIMGLLAISVLYFSGAEIEVNANSNAAHFLLITLPLLPLAFMEELGFRAYPLVILQQRTGIRWSLLITSLLFALYHIVNGWSVTSSFLGPAIWGLVFGLAAIYSNGIAMPTGMHYAANLTTAAFGAAGNTVSLWTIKESTQPTSKHSAIDWAMLLPAFALLLFAVICIELYIKNRTTQTTLNKGSLSKLQPDTES